MKQPALSADDLLFLASVADRRNTTISAPDPSASPAAACDQLDNFAIERRLLRIARMSSTKLNSLTGMALAKPRHRIHRMGVARWRVMVLRARITSRKAS